MNRTEREGGDSTPKGLIRISFNKSTTLSMNQIVREKDILEEAEGAVNSEEDQLGGCSVFVVEKIKGTLRSIIRSQYKRRRC